MSPEPGKTVAEMTAIMNAIMYASNAVEEKNKAAREFKLKHHKLFIRIEKLLPRRYHRCTDIIPAVTLHLLRDEQNNSMSMEEFDRLPARAGFLLIKAAIKRLKRYRPLIIKDIIDPESLDYAE